MKKTIPLEYNLKRPTINLSDLERILSILEEHNAKQIGIKVEYADEKKTEYEYANVKEIVPTDRKVISLSISCLAEGDRFALLFIRFASYGSSVSINQGSSQNRNLFDDVVSTLHQCENKFLWVIGKLQYLIPLLVLGFYFAAVAVNGEGNDPNSVELANKFALASLGFLLLGVVRIATWKFLHWGLGYKIILKKPEDAKGLFERNSDKLFVAIIAALCGALLTYLISN